MLTEQENQMLTQVGPGTPGGELLRRYWHPIAVTSDLERNATKRVRLLGEDLVLYKDRSGKLGLIEPLCAHRRVNMFYGIPETDGLRCPYHGWLYNETGACIQQPYETAADPSSKFAEKVQLKAYPAQELGGMIWAYLGPEPTPLIPAWEPLVRGNSMRDVGSTVIPCNWLQIMENSLDPVHIEWLHGAFTQYAVEQQGRTDSMLRPGHEKVGFDVFEHGIVKRRITDSSGENDNEWVRGHPILFPTTLVVGMMDTIDFQFRVPMDDEHTLHFFYTVNTPGIPVPHQEHPVTFDIPLPMDHEENGAPHWPYLDTAPGQDIVAWVTQGSIARREKERLGLSDTGIIMFRKLLTDNMQAVKEGKDPMNTFRDPSTNVSIPLVTEYDRGGKGGGPAWKYSPMTPQIRQLFAEAAEKEKAAVS